MTKEVLTFSSILICTHIGRMDDLKLIEIGRV